jgi:hypothetical protein
MRGCEDSRILGFCWLVMTKSGETEASPGDGRTPPARGLCRPLILRFARRYFYSVAVVCETV